MNSDYQSSKQVSQKSSVTVTENDEPQGTFKEYRSKPEDEHAKKYGYKSDGDSEMLSENCSRTETISDRLEDLLDVKNLFKYNSIDTQMEIQFSSKEQDESKSQICQIMNDQNSDPVNSQSINQKKTFAFADDAQKDQFQSIKVENQNQQNARQQNLTQKVEDQNLNQNLNPEMLNLQNQLKSQNPIKQVTEGKIQFDSAQIFSQFQQVTEETKPSKSNLSKIEQGPSLNKRESKATEQEMTYHRLDPLSGLQVKQQSQIIQSSNIEDSINARMQAFDDMIHYDQSKDLSIHAQRSNNHEQAKRQLSKKRKKKSKKKGNNQNQQPNQQHPLSQKQIFKPNDYNGERQRTSQSQQPSQNQCHSQQTKNQRRRSRKQWSRQAKNQYGLHTSNPISVYRRPMVGEEPTIQFAHPQPPLLPQPVPQPVPQPLSQHVPQPVPQPMQIAAPAQSHYSPTKIDMETDQLNILNHHSMPQAPNNQFQMSINGQWMEDHSQQASRLGMHQYQSDMFPQQSCPQMEQYAPAPSIYSFKLREAQPVPLSARASDVLPPVQPQNPSSGLNKAKSADKLQSIDASKVITPSQNILEKEKDKMKKLEIFQKIEDFSAGTFKYERNQQYRESSDQFEQEQLSRFYSSDKFQQLKNAYTPASKIQVLAKQFVADERKVQKPDLKHIKTYVPIFPSFYSNLRHGADIDQKKISMKLMGNKDVPANFEHDQETLYRVCQIKFSVKDNKLLDYEETREREKTMQEIQRIESKRKCQNYLLELEFGNIKTVWISRDNRHLQRAQLNDKKAASEPLGSNEKGGFYDKKNQFEEIEKEKKKMTGLNIIIQLKKPCSALKFVPKKGPSYVRSPLNMTSNLESDVDHERYIEGKSPTQNNEKNQANYETLTNYWNNHQVFQLSGVATKASVEVFIKTLKRYNESVKIHDSNQGFDQHGICHLDSQNVNRELEQMMKRGFNFQQQLNMMRPSLRYSILALLSNSKFNIFNSGLIEFMEMLNNGNWRTDRMLSEWGAYLIDHINLFEDFDFKDDSKDQLQQSFERLEVDKEMRREFQRIWYSTNVMRQRRVLVTPTLFHYTVAREEESNKVLRQYKDYHDQFIRLSFVQEDFEKGFYFEDKYDYILGYIHSIIRNGFFAGRGLKNQFLSYSNSQFKNHTCWFLAHRKDGVDEKSIMDSMGSFDHEKNILKRYARRGQCFSTTKNVCHLNSDEVCLNHPDIERNGFVFSDGCGLIHPDLALDIAKKYKLSNCSAFQIRLGGAKGVLAVSEDASIFKKNDGSEYKVLLRQSQIKFESRNFTLDIIRCATFSQGFLNRQTITLLHCLGVPTQFFLDKQSVSKEYHSLESIYERLKGKVEKIHHKFGGILNNNNPDFSIDFTLNKNKAIQELARDMKLTMDPCKGGLKSSIKEAVLKGIDIKNEPVFSSILHCMQLNQKLNLKKKARILLPDSCVLIGIVDPTGTLEEGEIFVQIRKDNLSSNSGQNKMERDEVLSSVHSFSEIILGKVLVTRNPCTHPGDIRLLKCVDKPDLRNFFNVVVFSSKGARPSCNMMSGGDLDGDVYFVAWDKELLSYIRPESIHEPADYSKNELIKEKPESDDIADYFVFYLQRDVLGKVSNLWLLLADKNGQHGPLSEDCIKLSHMCSVAVDFAKHGECVSKENFQDMNDQIKEYPDFLEKHTKPTFPSQGVLGQLYRDIDSSEALQSFIQNDWDHSIALKYDLDQNILRNQSVDTSKMHSYLSVVHQYIVKPMSQDLKECMMQFSLVSEGELFACDLKFRLCHLAGENTVYTGDAGLKTEDAIQNLNMKRRLIVEKYQSVLDDMVFEKDNKGDLVARQNLSAAIYLATYYDNNVSGQRYSQEFQSDPGFAKFKAYFDDEQLKDSSTIAFIEKLQKGSSQYHQICTLAEKGAHKKLRKLLLAKKLFCIPWLLVGDCILKNYPDRYDSPEFNQQLQKKQQRSQSKPKGSKPQQPSKSQLSKMSQSQKLDKIFGTQVQTNSSSSDQVGNIQNAIQEGQNQKGSNQEQRKISSEPDQNESLLQQLNDLYGQFYELKISEHAAQHRDTKHHRSNHKLQ